MIVVLWRAHCGTGATVPDPTTQTTSDQTQIASEGSREIKFRPVTQPGPISVVSTPAPVPTKSQSETGKLGSVSLLRPGSGTPVATASEVAGSPRLGLSHTTTAAELAAPGDWICRIFNSSHIPSTFSTVITSTASPPATNFPIKTASFDIPFLGTVLQEVAATAALRMHLEASGSDQTDKRSVASWSVPVANLIGGDTDYRFHIDDASKTVDGITFTYRVQGLNSDPAGPIIAVMTNPLSVVATLQFDTEGAVLKSQTSVAPDGSFEMFQITLTLTFDGVIVPVCDVKAAIPFNNYDVSSDVKSKVESQLNDMIFNNDLGPAWMQSYLEKFFVQLMRLSTRFLDHDQPMLAVGHIKDYAVQGNSLIVDYYQVPQPLITSTR